MPTNNQITEEQRELVELRAVGYAVKEGISGYCFQGEGIDKQDAIEIAEGAFISGAEFYQSLSSQENGKLKEALRWRDANEEVPKNQDVVLVRTDKGCFATAYYHGPKSGFITYGEEAYLEFGWISHWIPLPTQPR